MQCFYFCRSSINGLLRKLIRVLLRSFPILRFLPSFNFDFINSSQICEESRKIKFYFYFWMNSWFFAGIYNSSSERVMIFVCLWIYAWPMPFSSSIINKVLMRKIQEASSLILLSCLQIIKFTHALREFILNLSPLHCTANLS